MDKKVFKREVGDVLLIPLSDGRFGYGRVLNDPLFAFYDLISNEPSDEINEIIKSKTLFKVWVMKYAVTSGRWPILGSSQIENEIGQAPVFFKQDSITKKFSLYFSGGLEQKATYEECVDLERAAVWEPEHVESRLEDYFTGCSNKWVESLRAKRV